MTESELIEYYANLLIIQYREKPKAYNTIKAIVKPFIMNKLALDVQAGFNIETAVGKQLDMIGKYVGVTRSNYTFTSPIVLDDNDFRVLIKIKLLTNYSGSSLADIQNIIFLFFPKKLLVFDYQNMRISYFFSSEISGRYLAEVFIMQGLLPKPMGVQLSSMLYITGSTDRMFGYRTYEFDTPNNTGFNSYDDYNMDKPWLDYHDAVVIS